jgi:DNA-binding CsgD family transcriptional regulator
VASPISLSADGLDGRLPRDDAEALPILIGAIYDAALDPMLWQPTLAAINDFTQSFSTVIFERNFSGTWAVSHHTDGNLDPGYKAKYLDHYAALDPVREGYRSACLDQPFTIPDLLDLDRERRTAFHQEWSRPQEIVDLMMAPIERTGDRVTMFGSIRGARNGMGDSHLRRRIGHLSPHVRRAMKVSRLTREAAGRAADLGAALNGLSAAVFFLDADGRIVDANTAGRQELEEQRVVARFDGRLRPFDPLVARALNKAILAVGEGRLPTDGNAASVALVGRDETHYVAHVLPLTGETRRATSAVFLHPAETAAAPELAARAYRLTPMERRVLASVLEAQSVGEIAADLGLTSATVKTHLHHIFAKTGVTRQTGLIKLVAGFAGPLNRNSQSNG